MIFTPGNIITLCISLALVIIFRQADKNNRSIEKVKKFGDRLKEDLELFIRDRTSKLEESSIALDVQQTKAVAAVKRLESIREELAKKEAGLMDRTRAVEDFGKQIAAYDATIKQLLEMTALAETNLARITSESDFADSLGKKVEASKKQLGEISAAIPALRADFARENTERLSSIHAETMQKLSATIADLERRVETAHKSGTELVSSAGEKLKDLYQKAFTESAKRADSLEDAAFAKLKEQASERLARYKETIEEKTAALNEQTKERLQDTQHLVKAFKADWQAESAAFLESGRADLASYAEETGRAIADLSAKLETAARIADSRAQALALELKKIDDSAASALSALDRKTTEQLGALERKTTEQAESLEVRADERLAALESKTSGQASSLEEKTAARISDLASKTGAALADLEKKAVSEIASLSARIHGSLTAVDTELSDKIRKTGETTDAGIAEISGRLDTWRAETEYRLEKFDALIGDVDRLEGQLRITMSETEKRVTGGFDRYAGEQQLRQDDFERRLKTASDVLSEQMKTLETGLNELKSRAYENVSEKLKVFEDDFFADLARRGDSITAALDRWRANVDERLESLSAETESSRKDTEDTYTRELKERLSAIGEQYRAQTARLEEQIASVENALRARITASDQSILSFVEQYRAEFAQARETAAMHVKSELDAHALSVQETLRKQEREVESRTKDFVNAIDAARNDSEAVIATIRSDFDAWQARNEQQLSDAKNLLSDKIATLDSAATASIAELDAAWQTGYREFAVRADDERKQLKESLEGLRKDMADASTGFDRRSAEALASLEKAWSDMSDENARRAREAAAETDQTVRSLRSMAQEIRENVEQTREKLFQKVQSDTASLGNTLDEIDRKQKAFIAQTRVFERADELKASLETGIENLKNELSRLDVYRDTMSTLEQQYGKVRKLEEETNQKVTRFMSEKKRIDILEADFTKLLGLSDSIDRKLSELTLTNDDLQQYQVQIRRFEESVTEVNARYERLEKKAVVLDQTAEGVDKAFENLSGLEKSLQSYREKVASLPAELEAIRSDLAALLENRDKTALSVEKLSALDSILEDVEKRTEKMQTAREWLARTETRLEEISKQSQDQLKLLGDLIKDDGAARKAKGAPPIGIRENVVKLAHQGWKVDEIARALHLSRGEVELILELPSK